MSADLGSVVKKGKNCVAVAKSALHDIRSRREQIALEKLSALQNDASFLASDSEDFAKRLEAVDIFNQNETAEILRKIGDLSGRENQLKNQKRGEESQLTAQQTMLDDNQSRLSSAEGNLRNAERKRRKAEEEEKNIQIGSTVGGALLGLFTGGAGFLIGAAAGAGIGAMVNACRDEEKHAQDVVDRRRSDVESARSAVNESQRRISNIESQIRSLTHQIENMQRQRAQLHEKVGKIKKVTVIAKKSVEFWRLFRHITEHSENRTALLKKIVTMAAEEGDYEVLQLQPSQGIANTFIEAWEKMETTLKHGELNRILEIKYKCSQCTLKYTALPYVYRSTLVCMECHSKHALKN